MDNIVIGRENVTKFLVVLIDQNFMEAAHKQCQHKNIKKHWYPLQI